MEAKHGYQQLMKAEKLDREVLVAQHNHTKETMRIKLNKI